MDTAERLLRKIADSKVLYQNAMDLDAEVANYLSSIEAKESAAGRSEAEVKRELVNQMFDYAKNYKADTQILDIPAFLRKWPAPPAPTVQSETPEEPAAMALHTEWVRYSRHLRSLLAQREKEYYELLYAVGNKWPNESRHETALRYIRNAESHDSGPHEAAERGEGK